MTWRTSVCRLRWLTLTIAALSIGPLGCSSKQEAASAKADRAGSTDESSAKPSEQKATGTPTAPGKTVQKPGPGKLNEGPKTMPAPPDVAQPPADAKTTESGLAYKILQRSDSEERPSENDAVQVHYTGWTTDGKMFDSSRSRGRPATFGLRQVIAGWTEGLQLMAVGDQTRFWIPEDLAYQGRPGKPAGMLVFDVELLAINRAPEVPKDVAAAPSDAVRTESGLAYKVLSKGKGTQKPTATSRVTVHYSGWTTDGKMFDSSRTRGQPITFPLNRVIKGWTEGLQLMSIGDQYRFWIPKELAYNDKPGRPQGTLVFDVELLDLKQP
jgi:peptidylprolyl isomerase